jgi:hypothetical protein
MRSVGTENKREKMEKIEKMEGEMMEERKGDKRGRRFFQFCMS